MLINCYKDPADERFSPYHEWVSTQFDVTTVHCMSLESAEISQDAIITTGSTHMLTREPISESFRRLCLETTKPFLGLCYGHQALASSWGAKVVHKKFMERDEVIRLEKSDVLLQDLGLFFTAFESHAEHVVRNGNLKKHFEILAYSDSCKVEVIRHHERPLWGVQFHPEKSEVVGKQLLTNFSRIVSDL